MIPPFVYEMSGFLRRNRMVKVIKESELELRPGGTARFEGEAHGAAASFFHVRNAPGQGATRHVHPYAETWLVLAGRVRFTVGGEDSEAAPGDIVVAPAAVPHGFVSLGPEMLEMVCIHPSARILQQDLV
jgi:quercetin dioxygenase-like cupin family protein